MKKCIVLLWLLLICLFLRATPIISNIRVSQRTDGSKLADIYYDLTDDDSDSLWVTQVTATNDNWQTFVVLSPYNGDISGDCGVAAIYPGSDKHIVWDINRLFPENYGNTMRVKITINEKRVPANFVYVQGGTFGSVESPITVSSYYIDRFELTQSEYQAVMGNNPASGYGVGADYPVYYVTWFYAIEYCNRRSIIEGLAPCYSYDTYGTDPSNWPSGWNGDYNNRTNVSCNWTVNGYRLPTEAEWQFAAQGGNQTHNYTYSGSNDINAVAWYWVNGGYDYIAHTVGSFAANELGIFDMSGNVWEWNWDIYGSYPIGEQTNPHGATSGSYNVYRGGSWLDDASYCNVSYRNMYFVNFGDRNIGFRLVRVSP